MELRKGLERGPFNDKQAEKLSEALSGLDSGQLYWLSGYFSGLNGAFPTVSLPGAEIAAPTVLAAAEVKPEKIHVLFGSHTGNSEALAYKFAEQAKERKIETEVLDMAVFKTRDLKTIKNLAVIVSTHGLGEPPVQAEDLYNYLHGKKAPDLSHIQYSVLALGDSSYVDFCQTGKDFDTVLEKLGAKRFIPRQDCDVDYEDGAETWQNSFLDTLAQATPTVATTGENNNAIAPLNGTVYSKKNLFEATILEKINLNGSGSSKETIHLELDLQGSGLTYEPGDALGVYGTNPDKLVQAVLEATNLSGNEQVKSHAGDKTLLEALTHDYELSPLSKTVLSNYAELTDNSQLKKILEDNATVNEYLPGRDILDVIKEEPHPVTPE